MVYLDCQSIHSAVHPSTCPIFLLSICPRGHQSIIHPFILMYIVSIRLSDYLSIHPSIHPSIHLSISPFIPRSIQQAILYFYSGTKTLNVQRSRQDIIRKQLLKFSCSEKNTTGRKISISNTRKQPRLGRSRHK